MITINITDIRKFFQRASAVKSNSIVQVLDFVKMDVAGNTAKISKSNMTDTISLDITVASDITASILLHEKILIEFIKDAASDIFTITILEDNLIRLYDGKTENSFATHDVSIYPTIPVWDELNDFVELGEDVLKAIKVASNYTGMQDGNLTNFSFVHLVSRNGKSDVFASNNPATYLRSFDVGLPPIALSVSACNAISDYFAVRYQKAGNIDLFKVGETTYGFTAQGFGPPAYTKFVDELPKDGGYTIKKDELTRFCNLAQVSSTSKSIHCDIADGNGEIAILEFIDHAVRVKNKAEISVEKQNPIIPIRLNVKTILPALKALPYKDITLIHTTNFCIVTNKDDPDYLGILMAMTREN